MISRAPLLVSRKPKSEAKRGKKQAMVRLGVKTFTVVNDEKPRDTTAALETKLGLWLPSSELQSVVEDGVKGLSWKYKNGRVQSGSSS